MKSMNYLYISRFSLSKTKSWETHPNPFSIHFQGNPSLHRTHGDQHWRTRCVACEMKTYVCRSNAPSWRRNKEWKKMYGMFCRKVGLLGVGIKGWCFYFLYNIIIYRDTWLDDVLITFWEQVPELQRNGSQTVEGPTSREPQTPGDGNPYCPTDRWTSRKNKSCFLTLGSTQEV